MYREYMVVEAASTVALNAEVSRLLVQGWVPVGGVAYQRVEWHNDRKGYDEAEEIYLQAVALPTT